MRQGRDGSTRQYSSSLYLTGQAGGHETGAAGDEGGPNPKYTAQVVGEYSIRILTC